MGSGRRCCSAGRSGFTGCRQDMFDQPKYRPLAKSQFYADGRSARPVPAGTFEYRSSRSGEAVEHRHHQRGISSRAFLSRVDEALLSRGQERFNIYCSPCHGRLGDGHGMVAKRGFMQPANLHSERVSNAPPGYIYAVITNGYGAMPDYSDQVAVRRPLGHRRLHPRAGIQPSCHAWRTCLRINCTRPGECAMSTPYDASAELERGPAPLADARAGDSGAVLLADFHRGRVFQSGRFLPRLPRSGFCSGWVWR